VPATLVRALALLQRYPVPLLLPVIVIVTAGMGVNHALVSLPLSKFGHFLATVAGLLIKFSLTCLSFLCVANYTAKNEANDEQPEVRNMFASLGYPGYKRLLAGLLTRFALTIVGAGALTMIVLLPIFGISKALTHHAMSRPVSGQVYLWLAIIFSVLILSRWALAIPLFVQSEGMLKSIFATSAKAIRGRRSLVIVFTLLVQALAYPLIRLTSPLHPHLSVGAAQYVPQLLEIIAAHGFSTILWTYWMIVITMLTMRLQGHDEPLPVMPAAA
jgi:hypothetical protein